MREKIHWPLEIKIRVEISRDNLRNILVEKRRVTEKRHHVDCARALAKIEDAEVGDIEVNQADIGDVDQSVKNDSSFVEWARGRGRR